MSVFSYELKAFKFINQQFTHEALDPFFVFITELDKSPIMIALIAAVFLLIWRYKGRVATIKAVFAILLSVSASDLISYRIVKPLVNRPRPSHVVEANAIVRVEGKGGYHGFTSNHAANSFAYAYVIAKVFPAVAIPIFTFAGLVAYSRIYVGVHFLGDVIFGAMLGLLIASLFMFLLGLLERRYRLRSN